MLPMEKATSKADRENRGARSLPNPPRAVSITYMGPPTHWPEASFCRYFTLRRHSENLVAKAGMELSSIHTSAPGPPVTSAAATPTMFPVPMVAARAVISAEKEETPPEVVRRARGESAEKMARPRFRTGKKRVRRVRKTPVPSKSEMVPPPHRAFCSEKSSSIYKPPF